jgi:hypothetical protein
VHVNLFFEVQTQGLPLSRQAFSGILSHALSPPVNILPAHVVLVLDGRTQASPLGSYLDGGQHGSGGL